MTSCVPANASNVASTGPASARLRSRPTDSVLLVTRNAVTKSLPGPVTVPSMATPPLTGTGGGTHLLACARSTVPLTVSSRFAESSTR